MDDREFENFDTTIEINGQRVGLRIMGAALHALWGAGTGPQDAPGLFEANRAVFEQIAAELLDEGQIWDDLIVITDADLDL